MPLIRVHKASDGKLFENYEDYVVHEEGIKFDAIWNKNFAPVFEANPSLGLTVKEFIQSNQLGVAKMIEASVIKRKGGRKK